MFVRMYDHFREKVSLDVVISVRIAYTASHMQNVECRLKIMKYVLYIGYPKT